MAASSSVTTHRPRASVQPLWLPCTPVVTCDAIVTPLQTFGTSLPQLPQPGHQGQRGLGEGTSFSVTLPAVSRGPLDPAILLGAMGSQGPMTPLAQMSNRVPAGSQLWRDAAASVVGGSVEGTAGGDMVAAVRAAAALTAGAMPGQLLAPEDSLYGSDAEAAMAAAPVTVMHSNLVTTLRSIIDEGPDPAASSTEDSSLHQQGVEVEAHSGSTSTPVSGASAGVKPTVVRQSSGSISSEVAPQPAIVSVDLIHNRRPYSCHYEGCSRNFRSWQMLMMHLKSHNWGEGKQPLASPSSRGEDSAAWSGKYKAGQNKKIPTRCPECGNTFVGLYELRRHFGRKHQQGEKPHACRKCSKRFFVEVDLRDHEKVCGETMQCCCGLRFAFKCNLVSHIKVHPECQKSTPFQLASGHAATAPANYAGPAKRQRVSPPVSADEAMRGHQDTPKEKAVKEEAVEAIDDSHF